VSLLLLVVGWACLAQEPAPQSPVFDRLLQKVQKAEADTNSPPGPIEVTHLIYEARAELSKDQIRDIWRAWRQAQRPDVSKDDLIRLARGRRQAIGTLDCRYTIQRFDGQGKGRGTGMAPYEEARFAMDGSKARLERSEGSGPDGLGNLSVFSYDGQYVRFFRDDGERRPYGFVDQFRSRMIFFNSSGGLMHYQMLLKADEMSLLFVELSLEEFLGDNVTVVAQRPYRIGGRPAVLCVFGTPPSQAVWLDVERGCAVLKLVHFDYVWDGGSVDVNPGSVRLAEDFTDYGNGIWLPSKTTIYQVPPGTDLDQPDKFIRREELRVLECVVNKPVEDAVFRDIFPAGTNVSDTVANVAYIKGDIPDSGPELSEFVERMLAQPGPEATEPKGVDTTLAQPVPEATEPKTVGDGSVSPRQDAPDGDRNRAEGNGELDSGTRRQWLVPAVAAGFLLCAGIYRWRRRPDAGGRT
jgi:hypothetical protein